MDEQEKKINEALKGLADANDLAYEEVVATIIELQESGDTEGLSNFINTLIEGAKKSSLYQDGGKIDYASRKLRSLSLPGMRRSMAQTIADQGWRLSSYSPSSIAFDEDRLAVRSILPGGYTQDAIHTGFIADSQRIISPNKQDTVYAKPGYPVYSRGEAVRAPEKVRNELIGVVDDYDKISFHKEGGSVRKRALDDAEKRGVSRKDARRAYRGARRGALEAEKTWSEANKIASDFVGNIGVLRGPSRTDATMQLISISDPEKTPIRSNPFVGSTAQANSSTVQQSTPATSTPVNYDNMTFNEAFAAARKARLNGGAQTFMWKGNEYGTLLDSEFKKYAERHQEINNDISNELSQRDGHRTVGNLNENAVYDAMASEALWSVIPDEDIETTKSRIFVNFPKTLMGYTTWRRVPGAYDVELKQGGKINKCQGGWQALVDDSPEAEAKRAAIQAAQGTIESDDRSAARRAYDRVATAYRNSDFANSAPAGVLAMMTPYGMVHYSMGDRDNGADQLSAVMSLPIFGALGTVSKAGKAVADPAKRVVSRQPLNADEINDMLKYRGVKLKSTKPDLVKKYTREERPHIGSEQEYLEYIKRQQYPESHERVDEWRRYILNNK